MVPTSQVNTVYAGIARSLDMPGGTVLSVLRMQTSRQHAMQLLSSFGLQETVGVLDIGPVS